MPTCISCGFENDEHANFCLQCGTDMADIKNRDTGDFEATKSASKIDIPTVNLQQTTEAVVPEDLTSPASLSRPEKTNVVQLNKVGSERCSVCDTVNMRGMKFCGNCGSPLGEMQGGRTQALPTNLIKKNTQTMCKLVSVEMGGKEGPTFTLEQEETTCGRSEGDILFYKDNFVSPLHCTFHFKNEQLRVVDEKSVNGVYQRLRDTAQLKPGDTFRVGQQVLRLDDITKIAQGRAKDQTWLHGSLNEGSKYRLVQLLPDNSIGEARILHHPITVIGREVGNVLFPNDGFVSSQHCQIEENGETLSVKDLNSSNGTYLRIRGEALLEHGDFVLIGDHMLRVEILTQHRTK